MNAQEAKQLTEKNQVSLDELLGVIKATAEIGESQVFIHKASDESIKELMRLGYKTKIHTDPINGMEMHVCSW